MISRLVLNLRKMSDRGTNISEPVSRTTILFAPNPELPVRTQTQVSISVMAFGSDIQYSHIILRHFTASDPYLAIRRSPLHHLSEILRVGIDGRSGVYAKDSLEVEP